jgi:hypothetical protein
MNAEAPKVADDKASKFFRGDIETSKDILSMGLESYPIVNQCWY